MGVCGVVALTTLVSGCVEDHGVMRTDGVFARGDTGDSGLYLEPQCAEPGFCGCDFTGYDLDGNGSDETCVHDSAVVDGEVQLGARVEAGAEIGDNAVLGEGAVLGTNSFMAPRSSVGAGAIIGANVTIGRRAQVGANAHIGDDSTIGRAAVVGADVDASVGLLSMGYASEIGARSEVTGVGVVLGNLASVGEDSVLGAGVVLARGATFGNETILGDGAVVGPEVSALDGVQIGAGSRIRKGVIFASDVTLGTGVRIGRDTELREGSTVGDGAVLRALVTVGTHVTVESDVYIPRGTVLEDQAGGAPFVVDAPPVIVITSPSDGADSNGGSVTVTGTVSDDIGVSSVTLQVDNGLPVSVPVTGGSFSYTVTGIPDQSSSIIARAFDTSGQTATDEVRLSDCNVAGVSHRWTGAVDDDWNTAANWSAGTVPTTSSTVFVCGDTPIQPTLAQNVSVSRVQLDWDAEVATAGFDLRVTSSFLGGRATGTGRVIVSGGGVRGEVPNLLINGNVGVVGSLRATRDATVSGSGARLNVYTAPAHFEGAFTSSISGSTDGLNMLSPLSRVEVDGLTTFTGSTNLSTTVLNQGVVVMRGNMNAPCSTSYDCLVVAGTRFEFAGTEPQAVTFAAGGQVYNRMGDVVVRNQAGVSFTAGIGEATGMGTLSVVDGGVMSTTGYSALGTGGTSVFSGSAQLLADSGTITINSDIDIRDTSTFDVHVLLARRQLVMSENSHLAAQRVDMSTALPYTSADYQAVDTRLLGAVTESASRELRMPKLTLPLGNGQITLNDATLSLTGDYEQSISVATTGINLNHPSARFEIGGDATFGGNTNMTTSLLNQGVITIGGDFSAPCSTSYDCIVSSGATFHFDGSSPQSAHFAAGGTVYNRIGNVVVSNPTGVTFTAGIGTPTGLGTLSVVDGGVMTANDFLAAGTGGTSLFTADSQLLATSGTITINSDIDVRDTATIDVNVLEAGRQLVMSEGSHLDASRVDMSTALPYTSADYTATITRLLGAVSESADRVLRMPRLSLPLGNGQITLNEATITLTGDYDQSISQPTTGINLNHPSARFEIRGDAEFGGNTNMTTSLLNQGVITIGGDFNAPCSTSYDCIVSSGATFHFDGTSPQTAYFAASGTVYNRIGNVVVSNPAGVTFSAGIGSPTGLGTLSVVNGGVMTANDFLAAGTGGTSLFTGNSRLLATSGTITIKSDIDVQDTATIDVNVLEAGRQLTMSEGSHLDANLVNMASALPYTSADYTATDTRLLGATTESVSRILRMPKLTLPLGNGQITLNAATLGITGDYEQQISQSTTGINLNAPSARLEIGGDATFGGNTNMTTSLLNQGVITIGGDFSAPCSTSYDCIVSSGATFDFDGTSPQTAHFAASGIAYNRIGNVIVRNPSGVTFTSGIGDPTALGTVSVLDGGVMTANAFLATGTGGTSTLAGDSTLQATSGTITINSDIDVQDTSTIDVHFLVAGKELTMSETSHLAAARVDMNSALPHTSADYQALDTRLLGVATLATDRVLRMPRLSVPLGTGRINLSANLSLTGDYDQAISAPDTGLNMTGPAGRFEIGGNATFSGNTNMASSTLNQGVVTVAGNFSAPCNTSYDCIAATGTRFIFDGSSPQTVQFAAAGAPYNRLGAVTIAAGANVSFSTDVYAQGDLDIAGTLSVQSGTTTTTTTDLSIDGGVLNNSGTVRYNGTFTNNGSVSGGSPVNY